MSGGKMKAPVERLDKKYGVGTPQDCLLKTRHHSYSNENKETE